MGMHPANSLSLSPNTETMGIVIGIDVGGSTTKIVGINGERIQSPMFITAADPVTSLFGAFGKYIRVYVI